MYSLLLFLTLVNGLNGLSCVDTAYSFRVLRKDFNWNNIRPQINETDSPIEALHDEKVCRVTIHVDYGTDEIDYINVFYGNVASDTCDYAEFGTTFTSQQDHIFMASYIDYVCSSQNFCELTFVNGWIKRLLGSDTNPLHNSINHLLSGSSKSSEFPDCYWDNSTSSCASHMCFALYEELKDIPLHNSNCSENRSSGSIYINVKTKYTNSEQMKPIELDYRCKKNQFNQEVSYDFDDHQLFANTNHASPCLSQNFASLPTRLRSTDFSHSLTELDNRIKSALDHVDRCYVSMEADYRQDDGRLALTYNQPQNAANQDASFDITIGIENSTASLWSSLYYYCSPPLQCDRKVVSKWIHWLIDINKQIELLESNIASVGGIQSYTCRVWARILPDTIDICFEYSYQKAESKDLNPTSTKDMPSENAHVERSAKATSQSFQNITCSRFHEKQNEVYRYVLTHIEERCTFNHQLKSAEVIAASTIEQETSNENELSVDRQATMSDSIVKSNSLMDLIKTSKLSPLTDDIEAEVNLMDSSTIIDELATKGSTLLAEDGKNENDPK